MKIKKYLLLMGSFSILGVLISCNKTTINKDSSQISNDKKDQPKDSNTGVDKVNGDNSSLAPSQKSPETIKQSKLENESKNEAPSNNEPETNENNDESNKDEKYIFPKPALLLNKEINEANNVDIVYDVKEIYRNSKFDKEKVFNYNENTINLVQRYFSESLETILTGDIGNYPKWYTYDQKDGDVYKNIPDLQAYFNQNGAIYKLNHKLMREFIQDSEIIWTQNDEMIMTKNLKEFLSFNFMKRKIYFQINSNNINFKDKIEVDLEEVINNRNQEIKLFTYDDRMVNTEYYASLNDEGILKLIIKNLSHNQYQIEDSLRKTFNQNNKIYLDKYKGITTEISYLTLDQNDQNFSLSNIKNEDYAKLSSNEEYYKKKIKSGEMITKENSNSHFKEIRKRVFVVGGGTSTMVAKVKPSDPNDLRYYFITNRHVSDLANSRWNDSRVMKKFLIPDFDDNKVRNSDNDISIAIEKSDITFNFWESKDQTNRDGILHNDPRKDADISISIIDIASILEKAKRENNTKIVNYLENWNTLKPLKLSNKIKSLNWDNDVQFYVSSFPQDSLKGFSGRRYREHAINKIDTILEYNDQAPEFTKYGMFRSFVQQDKIDKGIDYDLISGGSGSIVFDEKGDMVALFMQNIGNDKYGFGLLASEEFDYFGFETQNNPNSFKKLLEQKIQNEPNKYEMIEF